MWDWTPLREWLSGYITPYWTFPLLTVVQILIVMISIILVMAVYTLAERKVIGWMQLRRGPNRVNLFWIPGLGQPFADVIKLVFKEILIPADANGFLFRVAPFLALVPALAIWAVIPLRPEHAFANIDAGLLYVLALTSMGVYGIILAGWAANSKYAFLGAMRSAAQIVAYEIAMGFAMVGVLMASGSLNIGEIIHAQRGLFGWNWTWLFPLFIVYFISGVAETNRAPFDVAEGESEIVAGFHVDYSGMAFALFFIAEYVNMILISALTSIFFFGGWLSPFDGWLAQDSSWSARCGGIYTAHMRSEGDHIQEAVQETIDIAKASGGPAEIHHLKLMGRENWGKLDKVVGMVNAARASGLRITADMYTYTAGGTSLDASMPPWVHDGGQEAMVARLKNPEVRAKVIAAMRERHPKDWENLFHQAGADGMLILGVKQTALKPLIGKTIAQVAKSRGVSPEDAIVDLVIEDDAGVSAAYTFISEANIAREIVLPWVSFASDAESSAPEGVFLLSSTHPRAYGNFARIFAKYVRDEQLMPVEEAVRKLTSLPADNLSLKDRGRLRSGAFADLVIFDPKTFQDHSTYPKPMQYATGVTDVFINGVLALKDGEPTGASTGRVLRGRAWTGASGGGCRASAKDWTWVDQPPGH